MNSIFVCQKAKVKLYIHMYLYSSAEHLFYNVTYWPADNNSYVYVVENKEFPFTNIPQHLPQSVGRFY